MLKCPICRQELFGHLRENDCPNKHYRRTELNHTTIYEVNGQLFTFDGINDQGTEDLYDKAIEQARRTWNEAKSGNLP